MIEKWGKGRRDYSSDIIYYVVPTLKDWQSIGKAVGTFTLDPYGEVLIKPKLEFIKGAASHYITTIVIAADKNVLLSADILQNALRVYGYQRIMIDIPQSMPTSTLDITVKNYSEYTLNCTYYHIASQGYELVIPISRRVVI